ncbi:MAG: hypothetical protein M3Y53_08915 [Thermoproteota archaeon]|nr:hypothetical protein [Thermoproteota archaeon]
MANDDLQHQIEFERQKSIDDVYQATALVTFERGGRVQTRFTFSLISEGEVTVTFLIIISQIHQARLFR